MAIARLVPRFSWMPRLLGSIVLYGVLMGFLWVFTLATAFLDDLAAWGQLTPGDSPGQLGFTSSTGLTMQDIGAQMENSAWSALQVIWTIVAMVAVVLLVLWHRPIARSVRLRRAGQVVPEALRRQAIDRLQRSALVLSLSFLGSVLLYDLSALIATALGAWPEHLRSMMVLTSIGSSTVGLVSALFFHVWHRRRVHEVWLPALVSEEEKRQRPDTRRYGIKWRLWSVVAIAAGLPIIMFTMMVISSIDVLEDPSSLTGEQAIAMMGTYQQLFENEKLRSQLVTILESEVLPNLPALIWVNILDAPRLLVGILVGLLLVAVVSWHLVSWTHKDILDAIAELRRRMEGARNGDLQAWARVQSNDELADLAEGYNRMLVGLQEREQVKGLFGQYLTREVSEEILQGRVNLGGERYVATIMFSDIRDFTALSSRMSPEEIVGFLNAYLERMIDVILEHGGIIDKFIGDGILAVFGAPIAATDHADRALRAAVAMQQALDQLNEERRTRDEVAIRIGIGLHTGVVIAGNIGSMKKLEYTVIGDTVNVASRIESLNKEFGSSVLISGATWDHLSESVRAEIGLEQVPEVSVRGKEEAVTLYRLAVVAA